jgi:hypothetical protein
LMASVVHRIYRNNRWARRMCSTEQLHAHTNSHSSSQAVDGLCRSGTCTTAAIRAWAKAWAKTLY